MNLNITLILMCVVIAATLVSIVVMTIKEKSLVAAITPGSVIAIMVSVVCSIPVGSVIRDKGYVFTESETEAIIISAGYRGVTVEYASGFGEDVARARIPAADGYETGDAVTIIVKDSIFFAEPDVSIKNSEK